MQSLEQIHINKMTVDSLSGLTSLLKLKLTNKQLGQVSDWLRNVENKNKTGSF